MSQQPDTRPYGEALANRVADYLMRKGDICRSRHRDYCGVALGYETGRFFYDYVYDGEFGGACLKEQSPILSFGDRAEFVAWLAQQSDESLCGRELKDRFYLNNQRLTRQRLEDELGH